MRCACSLPLALGAQERDDELTGRFRVGYRGVSVGGEEGKYRQHYNLDDGPRLFEARFDYLATGSLSNVLDVVSFDLTNYGGDPFETMRFDVRKFGKYNFSYERLKSTYFYQDIIFPPGVIDPSLDAEGDFTSFNLDRVRDHAAFDLTLTPRASLDLDFNRYTRRGDGTTQLDISRDIFELDRPVNEINNEFGIAFQYRWDKLALVVQEQLRDFENAAEIVLPGANEGVNETNETELFFFFLREPYELKSAQTTVRATITPNALWNIQLSGSFENMDFDGQARERSGGISFQGNPFETDISGGGEIERNTRWIDADASFLVNERLSVVGGLWSNNLDQSGEFAFGESVGLNSWDIATTGVEAGLQYALARHLTVTGGLRYESREVDYGQSEDEPPELRNRKTSHTGLFFAGNWNPQPAFDLNAQLETGSYNDPFTLVSPTSRVRLRLQGNYRLDSGAYVAATYVARRIENDDRPPGQLSDDASWNANRDHVNLRVGYRAQAIDLSAGYAFVRAKNEVDQTLFVGGPSLFPILFESDANFFDGRFRWDFIPRWRLGGDLRFYDNDGSFALKRNDLRVYVETRVAEHYLLNLGYRYIDYQEKEFGFNDYDANLVEASIGYAW